MLQKITLLLFFVGAFAQTPNFDSIVDENEWRDAQRFSINYEIEPTDNGPAQHATEVFVTHTETDIYMGFIAFFDIEKLRSSLHHFKNLESLLKKKVATWLKKGGYLIINEYVGPDRLQYPKKQLLEINQALKTIPKKYRKIKNLPMHKNKVMGPGIIRMILADPSECIESLKILPIIHQNFNIVIEKPFGWSILSSVLKDIADHFFSVNAEKQEILETQFKIEDNYLKKNQSDFIFGVYKT